MDKSTSASRIISEIYQQTDSRVFGDDELAELDIALQALADLAIPSEFREALRSQIHTNPNLLRQNEGVSPSLSGDFSERETQADIDNTPPQDSIEQEELSDEMPFFWDDPEIEELAQQFRTDSCDEASDVKVDPDFRERLRTMLLLRLSIQHLPEALGISLDEESGPKPTKLEETESELSTCLESLVQFTKDPIDLFNLPVRPSCCDMTLAIKLANEAQQLHDRLLTTELGIMISRMRNDNLLQKLCLYALYSTTHQGYSLAHRGMKDSEHLKLASTLLDLRRKTHS